MKKSVLLFFVFLSGQTWAAETMQVQAPTAIRIEQNSLPTGAASSNSISAVMPDDNYSSNLNLKKNRKVGAGLGMGGDLGLYGAQVELNIQDEDAVRLGFSLDSDVKSFSLQWKRSFEGEYLAPYVSVGFARWYNSTEKNLNNKSYILNAVLDENTKKSGLFTSDFLVGSAGLQYLQLDGDWTGAGFYFEFSLLGSLNKTALVPSGGLGAIYYF